MNEAFERRSLLGWVVICLVFWAGGAAGTQWTDALGRRVHAPDRPERIVSLVPSVTELLFALGVQDRVVGVTRFCTYPPEARTKPNVGGYADPSLEAIVALGPDLVFATADATKPALIERLDALGIPVFVVYPRNLEETVAMIRQVGRAAGAVAAGEREATRLESTVAEIREQVAGRPRPVTLLCIMVRPLVVAGPGTLGGDLIAATGGRNAVTLSAARYPTWGFESLLGADPEVVVLSPHPGDPEPARWFRRWPELRATAAGRVVEIPSDWIHRPGPRLVLGLRALARALHPGVLSGGTP